MHSDQGRQFESGLFKELCAKLKIDKTRTTSFRPQSNGLVERYNRTLENTISKYISKNQRDWDEQLPWALMAYNSSEHETTKFSPKTPTRKPVPTSNFNTRQSCTVTRPREVTPPTTPILTRSIKPISPLSEISPCSISLGIEDYSSVSPVKKNLVDLFDSPTRQAVEEPREETSIGT
ncbi:Hypothetical predicted protein [Mytilus galloprovincialis]|uniref:Integrase catalytic domain-containing protein n=1 Tax=Mytilus galloprovincialis TaxID=29158 RepID=A0A8B6G419_MYTGA|nr:Hypothetical predicted protein [Mytilus galloprovincialis]